MIRSCYKTLMRFNENQPAVEIKWAFCGPNARVFNAPTPFRSANWESTPYTNEGLGEQRPGLRPWVNGARPSGLEGNRAGLCVPADWWTSGIPDNVVFPLVKDALGVPVCCNPSPGALALGGGAYVTRRGPGARMGALALSGGSSVDFRILPGALLLDGEAEVHLHPPAPIVTTCCPAVNPELIASFPVFGSCACLTGVICPIVWDGAKWEGTTLPFCSGHTLTVRFYCSGVGPLAWNFDLDIDGVNFITGGITFVGSCGPLHFEGSPLFTLAGFPGCTGFGQVVIDEP